MAHLVPVLGMRCAGMLALDTGTMGDIPRHRLDVLGGRVDVLEATNDVGQHATR